MTIVQCAPHTWELQQSEEGHRDYWVTYLVATNAPYGTSGLLKEISYPHAATGEGPYTIGSYAGLPSIGDSFSYGSDSDQWAICHPQRIVTPYEQRDGEKIQVYKVKILFSTRPLVRCMTNAWGNPLLEPQRVSGSMVRGTIEATKDRNGYLFQSSSFEMFRGPQVEFDSSRPSVRIEQNVSTLQLGLCTSMVDTLNDDTLWGIAARRVKLSNFTWEEKWYDVCSYYYTRIFDFEIKNKSDDLWDRKILDEGTKVLSGRWADEDDAECGDDDKWILVDICDSTPDPDNPQHFIRFKDHQGENSRVKLNGAGVPASTEIVTVVRSGSGMTITGTAQAGDQKEFEFEYYPESDFTELAIPTTIDFGTGT